MPMRIKVDEDLPIQVADLLRSAGHDACTVVEQGLVGAADDGLWKLIQQEQMCLITADKGFANARAFPPGTHCGVVLMRLRRESRGGYVKLTESLVAAGTLGSAAGTIIVVTPDTIRIHRGG